MTKNKFEVGDSVTIREEFKHQYAPIREAVVTELSRSLGIAVRVRFRYAKRATSPVETWVDMDHLEKA